MDPMSGMYPIYYGCGPRPIIGFRFRADFSGKGVRLEVVTWKRGKTTGNQRRSVAVNIYGRYR